MGAFYRLDPKADSFCDNVVPPPPPELFLLSAKLLSFTDGRVWNLMITIKFIILYYKVVYFKWTLKQFVFWTVSKCKVLIMNKTLSRCCCWMCFMVLYSFVFQICINAGCSVLLRLFQLICRMQKEWSSIFNFNRIKNGFTSLLFPVNLCIDNYAFKTVYLAAF